MPSAKYSWVASPVKFSNGSTAREPMTAGRPGLTMRRSESRQLHPATAAAITTPAMADANHNRRGLDEVLDSDSSAGSSATAASDALETPSIGAIKASCPSGKDAMEAINRYPFPETVLMKAGLSGLSLRT